MAKMPVYDDVLARLALPLALRTATANGTAVDKADLVGGADGFTSVMLVVLAGTITDGTHTVTIQDSDDGSTGWANAAAEYTRGAAVALTAAQSNTIAEIGYDGSKRYIRATVTVAGATTGGTVGAVAVLGGETPKPLKR